MTKLKIRSILEDEYVKISKYDYFRLKEIESEYNKLKKLKTGKTNLNCFRCGGRLVKRGLRITDQRQKVQRLGCIECGHRYCIHDTAVYRRKISQEQIEWIRNNYKNKDRNPYKEKSARKLSEEFQKKFGFYISHVTIAREYEMLKKEKKEQRGLFGKAQGRPPGSTYTEEQLSYLQDNSDLKYKDLVKNYNKLFKTKLKTTDRRLYNLMVRQGFIYPPKRGSQKV
jgi:hypothetical protein